MRIEKLLALVMVLSVVGVSCLGRLASADGHKTLQVTATHYLVGSQPFPAGDEEGHVIGTGQREGEAVLSSGETAKYSAVFTFDARRGQGVASQGYTRFAFADGACIFFSWTAQTSIEQDGLAATKGEGTILKGTGRFEGIRGTSAFTGKEQKPASEDPKRTTVTDATLAYTLP